MDPFSILGIERTFDVDLATLEKTHRALSRALHPDRYVGAGEGERREALGRAVEVNEAWRVVRDPIRRAEALLALRGVSVAEDRRPPPDPDFLMAMLEQREGLSEAKSQRDMAAVRRLGQAIEARFESTRSALAQGFAKGESASLVGKLGELRFYRRFLEEVSAIEDELSA